jgi:hypothetical protein
MGVKEIVVLLLVLAVGYYMGKMGLLARFLPG